MPFDPKFLGRLLSGHRVTTARAISLVENEHPDAAGLLKEIFPHTGRAYRVGITGPPGAGKSTISNKLARSYRSDGKNVGIIAVDPTSPFTGGALLGDRVRMTDVELDPGVFIRSMASRGSLGGLSKKAIEAADILDAAGFDILLMETVGVGQSELDIARAADTTVVILVPESGDSIQAMKAGLMEIADFFVINKADRAGAEQAVLSIKTVLTMGRHTGNWHPEVLKTIASDNTGITEVKEMIASHRASLESSNLLSARRRQRIGERIHALIDERFHVEFWTPERKQMLDAAVEAIACRQSTPYDAVDRLLKSFPLDNIAIR